MYFATCAFYRPLLFILDHQYAAGEMIQFLLDLTRRLFSEGASFPCLLLLLLFF